MSRDNVSVRLTSLVREDCCACQTQDAYRLVVVALNDDVLSTTDAKHKKSYTGVYRVIFVLQSDAPVGEDVLIPDPDAYIEYDADATVTWYSAVDNVVEHSI